MKRIFKFILNIFLIMIVLCNFSYVYSLAVQTEGKELLVEYKGDCGSLIKRNGSVIKVSYVAINNNGIESPVYCLNKDLPGAESVDNYKVIVNNTLKDTKIYKAIKNGYPYKTPQQLNCADYKEAFTATKMAVYAVIYGYTIDNFESLGTEESDRTYNAIKTILENVNKTGGDPVSANINIIENTVNWTQDATNKNYVYKIMSVKSEGEIKKYNVYLGENFPEGTLITDKNNNYRENFGDGEEFKVSIPIKELEADGQINLRVVGQIKTNPIYIGETQIPGTQDYAVTKIEMEDGEGYKNLTYSNNETKIRIIKKSENEENLKNAVFELFDENKNIIMTNLITDENGEILIKDLIPGKYYIKEKIPPEGYENYEKFIEVNVKFNEELTVTVRNSKEEEPIVEIERDFLEISNIEEQIKLPKTGM